MRDIINEKPNLVSSLVNIRSFFNFTLDIVYKCSRLSKVLLEKDFELVPSDGLAPVLFFTCFILLLLKFDFISKK